MAHPRYIEIHTLHAYNAVLLNRDANGFAKRVTIGNTVRTRVSSQCLKRHWRMYDGPMSLHSIPDATAAIRSRETVERLVIKPLLDSGSYGEAVLAVIQTEFHKGIYGPSGDDRDSRQALLLGIPEIEYLKLSAKNVADAFPKDAKSAAESAKALFDRNTETGQNFQLLLREIIYRKGVENGLFGRMVTSDYDANTEGAVHVAHAHGVHQQEQESDYFTAVDDLLNRNEGATAAMLRDSELTSTIFYNYIVIDVPTLVSNLEECLPADWLKANREFAANVVMSLIHTIATVSPGAKLGSTAPYSYADFVAVEVGEHQPRTLSNAFRKPVNSAQIDDSVAALAHHTSIMEGLYGANRLRKYISAVDTEFPGDRLPNITELARWAADAVLLTNLE